MIWGTRLQRIVASVVLTAATLGLIGAVVLTTTPLGCGPAKSLRIKLSSAHCQTVASLQSPSPYLPSNAPSPIPTPVYPQPSPTNPYPQPASYNPYPQPSSYYPFPDGLSSISFPNPASGGSTAPGYPLNCRLPIYVGGPGSGGFILFPSGTFQPDPRSAVAIPPSPSAASPPPQMGPGYQGFWGLTYDRAYSRWLPVPYRWVSPDGKRYAYPGAGGGIIVQNVDTSTQVELGAGTTWSILDVGAGGVYAVKGQTGGLWLLPFAGGVTTITTSGYWQAVWGNFAYGTVTSQLPYGVGNTILRFDVRTGSATEFFSRPPQTSSVVAFRPNGNPVMYVQVQNGLQIWTGTGPNITKIGDLSYGSFYPQGPPMVDSHGMWLAGGGVVLWVDGQGWYPMSNFGGQLAGGCT